MIFDSGTYTGVCGRATACMEVSNCVLNRGYFCKIAASPDGGCYISWFQNEGGNYNVYMQSLDSRGNEQWAHGGVLVSNHTSLSSLVDYDLIADSAGNAVIVFTDARDGTDRDVFAYRVSSSGQQM
jgi:hypothetical protein